MIDTLEQVQCAGSRHLRGYFTEITRGSWESRRPPPFFTSVTTFPNSAHEDQGGRGVEKGGCVLSAAPDSARRSPLLPFGGGEAGGPGREPEAFQRHVRLLTPPSRVIDICLRRLSRVGRTDGLKARCDFGGVGLRTGVKGVATVPHVVEEERAQRQTEFAHSALSSLGARGRRSGWFRRRRGPKPENMAGVHWGGRPRRDDGAGREAGKGREPGREGREPAGGGRDGPEAEGSGGRVREGRGRGSGGKGALRGEGGADKAAERRGGGPTSSDRGSTAGTVKPRRGARPGPGALEPTGRRAIHRLPGKGRRGPAGRAPARRGPG